MDALCRITLLKPFRGDPSYRIPIGNGQQSAVPMGAAPSVTDPASQVGFTSDTNRGKAARDVAYYLGLGKDGSIMVPVSCAMTWFGDWTLKPGESQGHSKRTWAQERTRVAMVWGDFARMPRGQKVNNGVAPDTRIIAAPDVPHVKIEVLEQNGLPYGEAYDPWAFYHWDTDVDAVARAEAERMTSVPVATAGAAMTGAFTQEQLAQIAEFMKGQKSGKAAATA